MPKSESKLEEAIDKKQNNISKANKNFKIRDEKKSEKKSDIQDG
jgi:hypothetical protein